MSAVRQPMTTRHAGLLCPADAGHGRLLEIEGRLRCVHVAHDGRPTTHPLGAAPMTRSLFSLDEGILASAAPIPSLTRWRAPLDNGIRHAYPARGRGAAACGRPTQDERFDYPVRSRCSQCAKRVGS